MAQLLATENLADTRIAAIAAKTAADFFTMPTMYRTKDRLKKWIYFAIMEAVNDDSTEDSTSSGNSAA